MDVLSLFFFQNNWDLSFHISSAYSSFENSSSKDFSDFMWEGASHRGILPCMPYFQGLGQTRDLATLWKGGRPTQPQDSATPDVYHWKIGTYDRIIYSPVQWASAAGWFQPISPDKCPDANEQVCHRDLQDLGIWWGDGRPATKIDWVEHKLIVKAPSYVKLAALLIKKFGGSGGD